ncbi:MAG: cytochrome c oxidase subunit II [Actinomycetota bacterium]|nr:cytochrome c oxidase subunit II [Actinomycetota bacterium]
MRAPGRRRGRLAVVPAVLALVAFLVAGCAKNAPQDTLSPEGPAARTIDNLIEPVFIVAGVIFVLVEVLVVVFTIRYRQRRNSPDPVQIEGNTRLELFWTVVPALILFFVAIPTLATIFKLAKKPADALAVTVVGHQFWWEYRYDDFGIVTANELHIPAGQPVEISLEGADVIHSFWVPKLAGKTDVVPGRTNHMSIEADKPGTYLGQCVEFCGISHANMRLQAIAHTPSDFNNWVREQQTAATAPPEGSPAADGLSLWNAKGCGGCHTVEGVSKGNVGPNLTHLYSREVFAGSLFALNDENLRKWLANPPKEKPGSLMPDLNLSPEEITSLIAYLKTLQ